MKKSIPVLSFFSGGGFLDIGFEMAGFESIWANECEPSFVKGYESGISAWREANHSHKAAKIACTKRIEKISAAEITLQAFANKRPVLFGIIGGPPCPDFSVGGKNRGQHGEHGKLSKIFVNKICRLSPDFFVFENVPGLLRTKPHREFFLKLVRKLETSPAKYICAYKVLNAIEFGVPQDRKRVFLIGIKPELFEKRFGKKYQKGQKNWFDWPQPVFPEAVHQYTWPTIRASKRSPKRPAKIPAILMVKTHFDGSNPPSDHPNGMESFRPHSPKFKKIKEGDISRKSFKRLHRWRYSPTAAYGNNEVHLHPWLDRRLTVREALRLQSVPDDYVLPAEMSLTAKFKMTGNGVPVKLAQAVAESLYYFLTRKD